MADMLPHCATYRRSTWERARCGGRCALVLYLLVMSATALVSSDSSAVLSLGARRDTLIRQEVLDSIIRLRRAQEVSS